VGRCFRRGYPLARLTCKLIASYEVEVCERSALDLTNPAIAQLAKGRRSLIITTPTVHRLYGAALRRYLGAHSLDARVEVISAGEREKTIDSALRVCALAKKHELGRRDMLVAFGGGVCSDLVKLAAALVRRGIPYACLPTTLIGQVDAAVGLKGGVNYKSSKNYLGCFKAPLHVIVDPAFLATLPKRYLRCGMAEILKMALIRDADLFSQIESFGPLLIASGFSSPDEVARHVIGRSIALMMEELEPNIYEDRGLQRLVDFGHSFSPRMELSSGYRLQHGEAVAIDMALSSAVAVEFGLLRRGDYERIMAVFEALNLPTHDDVCTMDVLRAALSDSTKHRAGNLNLVVPIAIGTATFVVNREQVTDQALQLALRRLGREGLRGVAQRS
jgi:2-epi-5-epi-valiolone synthase